MGGNQSAQGDLSQSCDRFEHNLETISSQLAQISIPDDIDSLAEIVPLYSQIVEMLSPQASPTHIATIYLMISSHAQSQILSRTNRAMVHELEECNNKIRTMYARILATNDMLFQAMNEKSDELKDECSVAAEDGQKVVWDDFARQLDELGGHLVRLVQKFTKDNKGINDKLNTIKEQNDELEKLRNEANKLTEMYAEAKRDSDIAGCVTLGWKSCCQDALEYIQKSESIHQTLVEKYDTALKMVQDFKSRNVVLSLKDRDLEERIKSLKAEVEEVNTDRQTNVHSIEEMDKEIKLLHGALKQEGTYAYFQVRTARLSKEVDELRQDKADLGADLNDARADRDRLRVDLAAKQTVIDQALRDQKDRLHLKEENGKMSNQIGGLKQELHSLRDQLKEKNVKELKEHLRQTRAQLQQTQLLLKQKGTPQTAQRSVEGSADDPDLEAAGPFKDPSFVEGALELFKKQKKTLRELRRTVSNMKENRGGQGWSIVERADSMVNENTMHMIREIDDCLALRGAHGKEEARVEGLESEGSPTPDAVVAEAPNVGDAERSVAGLKHKKSKRDMKKRR